MLEACGRPRVPTLMPIAITFSKAAWTPASNPVRLREVGFGAIQPTRVGQSIGERNSKAIAEVTLIGKRAGAYRVPSGEQRDSPGTPSNAMALFAVHSNTNGN